MQIGHNANETWCKCNKMQMRHNANVTKYKCNKIQKWQNAKIPYINNSRFKRNSILGVPIEKQCVKGRGLLYGGFGLLIFDIFAFCYICISSHLHFVTIPLCLFAFCYTCNLPHLHFVCFWRFITFAFCQICILSWIPNWVNYYLD